jgi:hypothetical protein
MKNAGPAYLDDGCSYCLADEKTITFDVRNIQVECRQGAVWVTWPDGNECVLKNGQVAAVVSKGRICVHAFTASTIFVQKGK